MPAPLNVDREAVRVLAVAVGVREAARQMGLDENTVMQWSARYGWLKNTKPTQPLPKSMQPVDVVTVSGVSVSPAEALSNAMETLSTNAKLGFLKASARVAEHLADDPDPESLLARAKSAAGWAKTASLAGGWAAKDGATTVQVSVGLRLEMD